MNKNFNIFSYRNKQIFGWRDGVICVATIANYSILRLSVCMAQVSIRVLYYDNVRARWHYHGGVDHPRINRRGGPLRDEERDGATGEVAYA